VRRSITEAAAYGEVTYRHGAITGSLGGRLFSNVADDERGRQRGGRRANTRFVGASPSIGLTWQPAEQTLFYVRYAGAIRPGGLNSSRSGRYDADTLDDVDLGTRLALDRGRVTLDTALFRSVWRHVQSDYLQNNGLIASHNVGDASLYGGEWSVAWAPTTDWRIKVAGIVQSADLVRTTTGAPLPEDTRLPVVPGVAGDASIARSTDIGGWRATLVLDARCIGSTRLSFDPGLDRRTPTHADVGLGLSAVRGGVTLRVRIDNIADTRADTFAFGNPFSIRKTGQFTPLTPPTVTLGIGVTG
jgi:outer membrane receptor protein involved in Fe transport